MRSFLKKHDPGLVALLVCGSSLGLYWATAAPDVLGHDAGEFQFVPAILGIAHHTGYPLYTLLGKLWSLIPIGTVAYRMNLLSGLFGALTVALVWLATLALARSKSAGVLAAVALAVAPLFWKWSTIAGVRSLSALLPLAAILAALRWQQTLQPRWLAASAFMVGLGLAHHRSALFLMPLLVLFVLLVEARRALRGKSVFSAVALLVLPLMTYLYLPLRARSNPPFDQFRPSTWEGFWGLILATGVGTSFLTVPVETLASRAEMLAEEMVRQFGPLGVALGLVGWGALAWRNRGAFLLLASFAALVMALTLLWNMGPDRLNLPYLVPVLPVWAIAIGAGAAAIARALWSLVPRLHGSVPGLLPLLFLVFWVPFSLQTSQEQRAEALLPLDGFREGLDSGLRARRLGVTGFPSLESQALLLADWEQATVFWYLQLIEGVNPGVEIIYPTEAWQEALTRASGRPLYAARAIPGWQGRPLTMEGALVRLSERPERQLPPGGKTIDAVFGEEIALRVYTFWDREGKPSPHAPPPAGVLPVTLVWEALAHPKGDYSVSLRLLDAAGRILAQRDSLYPVLGLSPTTSWVPGQVVSDYYELPLPKGSVDGLNLAVLLYTVSPQGFANLPVRDKDGTPFGAQALLPLGR